MEGWGRTPSQPSNFVSILHLRERWLKEKEREQKEKVDLKKLELQEQQQKVPRTNPVEKDDQKPVVQKPRNNTSSWSRNGSGKFQGYYRAVPVSNPRNVTETCKKTVPVSNPRNVTETSKKTVLVSNPRIVTETSKKTVPVSNPRNVTETCKKTVPVSNPRNVNETFKKTEDKGEPELAVPRIERDEKKEKKSKRKGRKKKPNAQKEEMDKTLPTPEENLKEEMRKKEREVGVQNGKKNARARKIDEKKRTGSRCGPEKTGNTHGMKKIEDKLSLISVSFEIKRKGRKNGVYRGSSQGNRNFRDNRNLDRWGSRKQRDVGMTWVRKDELSKGA